MADTEQRWNVAVRWLLVVPFAGFGLLCVALAPASGLLSLPVGVLSIALTVWFATGATDGVGPVLKWTLAVSGGITVLMLLAATGYAMNEHH